MEYTITSEKHSHETLVLIYDLMSKGETALTETDTHQLSAMILASEKFEDDVLGLRPQESSILLSQPKPTDESNTSKHDF